MKHLSIRAVLAASLLPVAAAYPAQVNAEDAADSVVTGQNTARATGELVKWCRAGESVRYSNADLSAQGYQQCGEVGVVSRCSVSGQRIIGSAGTAKNGIDCGAWRQAAAQGKKSIAERAARSAPPKDDQGGAQNAILAQLVQMLQGQQSTGAAGQAPGQQANIQQFMQMLQSLQGGSGTAGKPGNTTTSGAWKSQRIWPTHRTVPRKKPGRSSDDLMKIIQDLQNGGDPSAMMQKVMELMQGQGSGGSTRGDDPNSSGNELLNMLKGGGK